MNMRFGAVSGGRKRSHSPTLDGAPLYPYLCRFEYTNIFIYVVISRLAGKGESPPHIAVMVLSPIGAYRTNTKLQNVLQKMDLNHEF